ncbi:MAG: methyltransferase domain-containing protein [Saprospiraceae bacterium]
MKIPILKSWASYIREIPVESIRSTFNNQLELVIKNGEYQLCTEHAVYSYGQRYTNFKYCFEKMNLSHISEVLILGLGLGSIIHILEKNYPNTFAFTCIEIDESVIYLASKYTTSDITSYVDIIQADATAFVQYTEEKYDLICVDLFIDDLIPDIAQSRDFLQNCAECLTPNGILVSNHLGFNKTDKQAATNYYNTVFKDVFPNSEMLSISKNLLMVSEKSFLK